MVSLLFVAGLGEDQKEALLVVLWLSHLRMKIFGGQGGMC